MERHWSESLKHQAKDAFSRSLAPQAEPQMTEDRTPSRPLATTGSDMIRQHGNRPYPKPSWAPRVDNALYFKALNAERAQEREKIRTWRRETGRSFADAAQGRDGTSSGEEPQSNRFNRAAARDGWRDTYANEKTRAMGKGRSR